MSRTSLDLPEHPFDYSYLMDHLKSYRYPRNKIQRMVNSGEIVRLKKGLYLQKPQQGECLSKALLANLLYGPSYLSLDYALSYWGLIPERVEELTCITNKRNKLFQTPFGLFSYRYLPNRKFAVAVKLMTSGKYSFFIASKEKALCEKLYFASKTETPHDMASFLGDDLRVDFSEIASLNKERLLLLKECFRHRHVSNFVEWYLGSFSR